MPRRTGKKKQRELDRPAAETTLGEPRLKEVRVRGGGTKVRALALNAGNFTVASEGVSARCNIVEVVYNPTDSDLVRRGIITKGTIVKVNTAPLLMHTSQPIPQPAYACITTRPGQSGRADGYVLEGEERWFYLRRLP